MACADTVCVVKLTPVQIDGAVALALTAVTTVGFRQVADLTAVPHPVALILVLLSVLPAAARRLWPRTMLALVTVASAAVLALSRGNPAPQFAVGFLSYLIPAQFRRRQALWLLVGTVAALALGLAVFAGTARGGGRAALSALAENALLVAGCWAIGFAVLQQRLYAKALREQAEREDRVRIARELHDVVAHGLSLIAVQAGVANWVVESQPAEAARALASIEQISRGALHEMRALLGVLRVDDAKADLEPTHGLADLPELVGQVTAAGIAVNLEVRGTPRAVRPGLDLAAYRVIQEAVTNVIKHSNAGQCLVTLTYEPDALILEVTDDGQGSTADSAGGHGIKGMRERVARYGGTFQARPLSAGGFGVTARFPS